MAPSSTTLQRLRHAAAAAATASMAGLLACHGHTTGVTEPPPSPPAVVEAPSTAKVAKSPDASTAFVAPEVPLSFGDCRALRDASALGIAVVSQSAPDCSGVGHHRIVLDLRSLARGQGITRVVASQPLASSIEPALRVGDVAVVAIEPSARPAKTVFCVPLPAHEGVVRHAVKVASVDEAEAIVTALAAGKPCPPEPCRAPRLQPLGSPESRPGVKPHPGWAEGALAYTKGHEAVASRDLMRAAERFLWCAEAHRSLLARGPNVAVAERNAVACYRAAAECFASAGRFASDGRAALEPAARGASPIAEGVRATLHAPPSDCER